MAQVPHKKGNFRHHDDKLHAEQRLATALGVRLLAADDELLRLEIVHKTGAARAAAAAAAAVLLLLHGLHGSYCSPQCAVPQEDSVRGTCTRVEGCLILKESAEDLTLNVSRLHVQQQSPQQQQSPL